MVITIQNANYHCRKVLMSFFARLQYAGSRFRYLLHEFCFTNTILLNSIKHLRDHLDFFSAPSICSLLFKHKKMNYYDSIVGFVIVFRTSTKSLSQSHGF